MNEPRCSWVGSHPLMVAFHDTEWGVPIHDDQKLFEFMVLDAMQAAGLVNDHLVDCYRYEQLVNSKH